MKNFSNLFKLLILAAVVAAGAFGVYSVYTFQNSEENFTGFFTCDKEGNVCQLSQHIHAEIKVNVCGQEVVFEREKGRTDQAHTHKERNKIHWHAPLNVHPETKIPLDPKPLTTSAFFEQMDRALPETCANNPKPSLKVTVNGREMPSKLDYVWADGDKIEIEYK